MCIRDRALGGLSHRVDIHPVGAGPQNSSQARRPKGEGGVKPLVDLFVLLFNFGKLLDKVFIVDSVGAPPFVFPFDFLWKFLFVKKLFDLVHETHIVQTSFISLFVGPHVQFPRAARSPPKAAPTRPAYLAVCHGTIATASLWLLYHGKSCLATNNRKYLPN